MTLAGLRAILRVPSPLRWLLLAYTLLLIPFGAAEAQGRLPRVDIALTFDDLPWSGPADRATRVGGNPRLIAALAKCGITAASFVNCANVGADSAILGACRVAGMELGNHSARHVGIDAVGAACWLQDVQECHDRLRSGTVIPRYVRYPMLRQGATRARRDSASARLAVRGYANAHVSIDNADYLLAQGYRAAMGAGETQRADHIAALYIVAPIDARDVAWDSAETARVEAALAPPAAQQPARPVRTTALTREDLAQFADSVFAGYLARYPEPSLALAVVHGDSVLLLRGYGTEHTPPSRAVHPESTLFNIASLSKLVTATAAMQQVERGGLTLDSDVRSLLPAGESAERDGPPITLRQLLSHTSGLDAPFMRDVVMTAQALVPLTDYFRRHPARRGRAPGQEVRYANYGMALAARLVELVTHAPFRDGVETDVLIPLGMQRSTFRQPPPGPLAGRVATAGAGRVPNALLLYPSGSMTSTAADMARFMVAHLNGGQLPAAMGGARVLSDASVRQMHTRAWSADPRLPGVALGFFETDIGGTRGLFHTGARTHFSLLYLAPVHRVGIFVVQAMQQGGEFRTLRTDFTRAFLARYFPVSNGEGVGGARITADSAGALRRARRFAGVYRPVLLSSTTIERAAWLGTDTDVSVNADGSLVVRLPGATRLHLAEVDSGLYRVRSGADAGTGIAFLHGRDGRVRGMALAGATQDPVSFERLAWFQRGLLHLAVLGISLLLFVAAAVSGVSGAIREGVRRRRGHRTPPMTRDERRAWRAGLLTSAFVILAPTAGAAMVLAHTGDDDAADNLRWALHVALTLLLLGAATGTTLVPLAIRAWRRGYWSRGRRLFYSALATAVVFSMPILGYYHLLGYWL